MKIMQVNVCYKTGSTGKIVNDIHSQLQEQNIDSVVCYGRGKRIKEPGVYKIASDFYCRIQALTARITGIMYGGCFLSTNKLLRIIKKEKPDIVHLHCINGSFVNIYRLVTWLKENKIKTVLTLHAEFMHTGNCSHAYECENWKSGCQRCVDFRNQTKSWFFDRAGTSWARMKKAFEGFGDDLVVTSVSPWLMERAKQSPILANKTHKVIFNGIDTSVFTIRDFSSLKNKYGVQNRIIFFATANFDPTSDDIKGGKYIIELAEKLKNEKILIVVAALDAALTDLPKNIVFIGKTKTQEDLAKYYSMADISLIVSRRETFCMPVAESLCCGTPVVGFMAGAPEQIALKEYSEFVEYGDIEVLSQCVLRWIDKKSNREIQPLQIARISAQTYSKERMVLEYMNAYEELTNQ